MKDNGQEIEKRLEKMKEVYINIGKLIDGIPEAIPDSVRELLKEKVLGDKQLKELMEGVDLHRPPRIFLMGRTGVGKSSLVNALCGTYVAEVSDVASCTDGAYIHHYKDKDRVLMDIFDTRGIAESEGMEKTISAENMLLEQIMKFSPDVALFVLNCTHRDDVDKDIDFLKKIARRYEEVNKLDLPIVVVVNKADQMSPARELEPKLYSDNKIKKIKEVVKNYNSIIMNKGLKIQDIIPISSYIEWETQEGEVIDVDEIKRLPKNYLENIQIHFDGRYNIEKLYEVLEESIVGFDAKMGMRMSFRLDEVIRRVAKHLTNVFAGISMTVAATPIPISDIYILIVLQSLLVALIASLSGRDVSIDSAKEFIFSVGGVAGTGYGLRLVAQQAVKLLNGVVPGSGSVISSGIAYTGTYAIGKAAIKYYIEEMTLEEVKKAYKKDKEENAE